MKKMVFGKSVVSESGPCYVIAEIGHNHQGDLATALEMIRVVARCGADAVKFQKRSNRSLYTQKMYDTPYNSENSYGRTYGEHREKLEFGWDEYLRLKACAEENGVEFMCTPFDQESLDFLEKLGISSYKFASGSLTDLPLLTRAAKLGKPMFLSTGAASMDEVRAAVDAVLRHNEDLCVLHCVCEYPAEYANLNLRVVETLKREFPRVLVGFSGHDNGILAPVVARMLGAAVIEKHFTLNRAWKGTDHRFSLEPEGLRKQVRDLRRLDIMLGDGVKELREHERAARLKMGKGLYAAKSLRAGHVLSEGDIAVKSPAEGYAPYEMARLVGRRITKDIPEETLFTEEHLDGRDG